MIAKGRNSIHIDEVLDKVTEADILSFYLGITKIPCIINSPLRKDNKPSFGIYSTDGIKVHYIDFTTKDRGGLFDLLCQMWGCDYVSALERVKKDCITASTGATITKSCCKVRKLNLNSETELRCRIREWRDYDLEYWKSYGISLEWLKYAEVYPISHKIITKDGKTFTFSADKYAYAYIERKEGKISMKVYQPYNMRYKWSNNHDGSVISLWTKIPEYGEKVLICSSLKDALCISANAHIPAIAVQGEGYSISEVAQNELKRRFKQVIIAFDGDKAGIEDSIKLQNETDFKILDCPMIDKAKDWSDIYHNYGKDIFLHYFNKALLSIH